MVGSALALHDAVSLVMKILTMSPETGVVFRFHWKTTCRLLLQSSSPSVTVLLRAPGVVTVMFCVCASAAAGASNTASAASRDTRALESKPQAGAAPAAWLPPWRSPGRGKDILSGPGRERRTIWQSISA